MMESRKAKYAQFISGQIKQTYKFPLYLVLLHIPLGILLYNAGPLALLHPIGAFVIGMRRALLVEEKLERVAPLAAYIVGAEILWRMAGVPIFWEFGKYGAAFIMLTALLRRKLWKIPAFPLFYFILLLPAAIVTLVEKNLTDSRNMISFNLSGPFLLFVTCWFFSYLKMNQPQLRKLFLALMVPLMSVAVTTFFYTVTTADIEFTGESNFATSGGFGPNQVSGMLGLGAFLAVAGILLFKNALNYTLFFGALAVLFTAQSVLTFSRGGMYNAVGAILLIVLFQMQNLKDAVRRLLPVLAISGIFILVIFPYLNDFTGGALKERFEDSEASGRVEIVDADVKIFAENPILGVGLGNAYTARGKFLYPHKAVSHTEFSRLTAEHGTFGLLAIGALILMMVYNFKKQESSFGKAFVVGFIGWSMLFMLNAGMRLAAPALILGMICLTAVNLQKPPARLVLEEKSE